jgi:hypothetical protein
MFCIVKKIRSNYTLLVSCCTHSYQYIAVSDIQTFLPASSKSSKGLLFTLLLLLLLG